MEPNENKELSGHSDNLDILRKLSFLDVFLESRFHRLRPAESIVPEEAVLIVCFVSFSLLFSDFFFFLYSSHRFASFASPVSGSQRILPKMKIDEVFLFGTAFVS